MAVKPTSNHAPAPYGIVLPILLLAAVSLFFRFHALARLPGINGDEAWYGVQVERLLAGQPYTLQAPTGVLVDPFQPPTEALLLRLFGPSFLVLRLPAALWQCMGLLAILLLHRWVYGNWMEAALVALLLSVLPMHLGYSRFSWSTSYLMSTSALILYPALHIAEHGVRRTAILMLVLGAILSIWCHLTALLLVALVIVATAIAGRQKIAALFRGRHRVIAILAATVSLVLAIGGFLILCKIGNRDPFVFIASAGRSLRTLIHDPPQALYCITMIGDLVSGTRAFHYFAGLPETTGLISSRAALLLVIVATILLLRSGRPADRAQAILWCLIPWALLLTGSIYQLTVLGNERYVIWIVTAAAPLLVRGLVQFQTRVIPRSTLAVPLVVLAASAFLLLQFWTHYFQPISTGQYRASVHRAWWTGAQEPKAQAAELIAAEAAALPAGSQVEVFAEDWWLQYPVQYLLGSRFVVHGDTIPASSTRASWFAVAFTGSAYHKNLLRELQSTGQRFEQTSFPSDGDAVVCVLRPTPVH